MSFNRKLLKQMTEESKKKNSLPKYKLEGWLDNYSKKPIVNKNGYLDGEPPAGSNWRIPGNKITMNLPGMPDEIVAVSDKGEIKKVKKGQEATFNNAEYVDEYRFTNGGDISIPNLEEGNWLNKYKSAISLPKFQTEGPLKTEQNKSYSPVNESLETGTQGSNEFLRKWNLERSKDPRFKKVATDRLNEIDKIETVHVSEMPEGAGAYYQPGTKKIFIDPNDPYSRGTSTQIHEKQHLLWDQVPQENQDQIVQNNTIDYETYNQYYKDNEPIDFTVSPKQREEQEQKWGYPYLKDNTEVASRLYQFRKRYNIDPNHKYTPEEMTSIMESHYRRPGLYYPEVPYADKSDEENQSGDFRIDELFKIIGDDPAKLAELNNEIVYQQSSQKDLNKAKTGGWLNKYINDASLPEFKTKGETPWWSNKLAK